MCIRDRIFRKKRWLLLPGLLVLGAALLLYARFVEPARLTVRTLSLIHISPRRKKWSTTIRTSCPAACASA